MMDERQFSELRKLLAETPTGALLKIKRLAKAEIDSRESKAPKTKRVIHPSTPWPEILTRAGIHD